jgi:DNA polymerase-3 subunit delta
MTPDQFLHHLKRQRPAPAYLFLGPERYRRGICRRALIEAALAPEERDQGLIHHDLDQIRLQDILDEARSFSLFAARRLIWASSAEAALPKGRAALSEEEDDGSTPRNAAGGAIEDYMRNPAPETVLVFECSRYEFDGDDRARIERVQKFYSAIPHQVEFRPLSMDEALSLARDLAAASGLKINPADLRLLVDTLAGDAARIALEIDKLSLYSGGNRQITAADIARLAPNAQENTIFELIAALGAGNRSKSLAVLDTLVRAGEYLPLALTFLDTQFRLALAAREAGLRTSSEIVSYFSRTGVRIWRDRAEQIRQTLQAFSKEKLEAALKKIFAADRGLREARPDDRIVLEELILSLTE